MDLNQYVGKRREDLVRLGRLWGSLTIKEQTNAILALLRENEEILAKYGILALDREELEALAGFYPQELEERTDKKLGNTLTSRTLREVVQTAHTARRGSRSLLEIVGNRLNGRDVSGDDPDAVRQERLQVEAALQSTSRKLNDAQGTHAQLLTLSKCLALPITARIAAPRGADRLQAALSTSLTALTSAIDDMQQLTTTSALTERLDLIDGLIVERLREISHAAKNAAKEEGRPQLAHAFRLSLLYGP